MKQGIISAMSLRHLRRPVFFLCVLACLAGRAAAGDAFSISTPAFEPGKPMPARYALADANVSPELRLANVPIRARSLVLIVDDPDAPTGLWTHWLVWNLSSATTGIPEGKLPPEAREGENSFGNVRYDGPAPPSGTHRYFFHLYALDTKLTLPAGSDRDALRAAMEGPVVGKAETFGTYRNGS
jgi:hypothetical protein